MLVWITQNVFYKSKGMGTHPEKICNNSTICPQFWLKNKDFTPEDTQVVMDVQANLD